MLAVLAGLLVAADVGARSVAESHIRDRVVIAAGPAGETAAHIDSFPFLLPLLTAGEVARLRVSAADVTVEGLTLARVALDRAAGQTLTATASISDNQLRLTVSGFDVPTLRIPRLPLLPCVAGAEILPGRIRMTCSVDVVPAELVGRLIDEVVGEHGRSTSPWSRVRP